MDMRKVAHFEVDHEIEFDLYDGETETLNCLLEFSLGFLYSVRPYGKSPVNPSKTILYANRFDDLSKTYVELLEEKLHCGDWT